MRVGLITSNHIRHRFLANTLAARYHVALVLTEEKKRDPSQSEGTPEQQRLLRSYFAERAAAEARLLREGLEWDPGIREVAPAPAGAINEEEWAARMETAGVELVAVFGSSILREAWLERFPGRMVNLHLGLSPYYRGAGTNFWPLYYEEPEYVGATIHLIDSGVDSGAILRHSRPAITAGDTPHTIGNKAIRSGARALARSLEEYRNGSLAPQPQWEVPNARYARNRDFTAEVLEDFLLRWDWGLLDRYLAEAAPRGMAVRLVREMSDE